MGEYFKIGKLVASFGLKGELVLMHSLGKNVSIKQLEKFFIEEKSNSFLPYFIETISIKNQEELYIKVEGIDTKESAKKLTPKEVWITEEDFKKFAAASAPISMLGFHLMDGNTDLGEILEVIEQPHQILCSINLDGKEALIPIHRESLEKIDKKKRRVYVILPDGLLDIYR